MAIIIVSDFVIFNYFDGAVGTKHWLCCKYIINLAAEKVSHLLGINSVDLIKCLIKPRIRVGTEYVQQGRNMEQCIYSIGALSKTLYERMFSWLVKRVNKTLDTKARNINRASFYHYQFFRYIPNYNPIVSKKARHYLTWNFPVIFFISYLVLHIVIHLSIK